MEKKMEHGMETLGPLKGLHRFYREGLCFGWLGMKEWILSVVPI